LQPKAARYLSIDHPQTFIISAVVVDYIRLPPLLGAEVEVNVLGVENIGMQILTPYGIVLT
jgi:hypothetical protein